MYSKKYLIFVLAIPLLLVGGCYMYVAVGNYAYSVGERSGTVQKVSYRGFPNKTWEGELNMGIGGGVWRFSVHKDNKDVIEGVQAAEREGGRVTLKYEEQMMTQWWDGDTAYFVTEVKRHRR